MEPTRAEVSSKRLDRHRGSSEGQAAERTNVLFERRGAKAHPGTWTRYLDAAPNAAPVPGDQLPED